MVRFEFLIKDGYWGQDWQSMVSESWTENSGRKENYIVEALRFVEGTSNIW